MKLTDAFIRTYTDNGQVTAYAVWENGSRTEGSPKNRHMQALLARFRRETGKRIRREVW